jgi:hypothetical protein
LIRARRASPLRRGPFCTRSAVPAEPSTNTDSSASRGSVLASPWAGCVRPAAGGYSSTRQDDERGSCGRRTSHGCAW